MINVGIVGGTGYTGVELLRLLAFHPQASVKLITSRKEAGMNVADMFQSLRGLGRLRELRYCDPADADLKACQVVFFATPHGVAMAQARELVAADVKIIDLAADFRLKDPVEFERWYKMPHSCPDLLAEAAYGLPEMHRRAVAAARIVGNPGCYPTAVQLGFLPLVEAGIVDTRYLFKRCSKSAMRASPLSMSCLPGVTPRLDQCAPAMFAALPCTVRTAAKSRSCCRSSTIWSRVRPDRPSRT